MDFDEFKQKIEELAGTIGGKGEKKEREMWRIPLRADWRARFQELEKIRLEEIHLAAKGKNKRDSLWADINEVSGLYDVHLQVNDDYSVLIGLYDKDDIARHGKEVPAGLRVQYVEVAGAGSAAVDAGDAREREIARLGKLVVKEADARRKRIKATQTP